MDIKKIIKDLIPYAFIILFVVAFRSFVATPVVVDGPSMDPTLANGQILILYKLSHQYDRFDIVVVKTNINGSKERLVKRIIGLPGDKVEYKKNNLYINDKKVKDKFAKDTEGFSLEEIYDKERIPNGYYFVMGDNREESLDSRDIRVGLIKKSDIVGKAVFRIWPFTKIGTLKNKEVH